jgi:hypothetical protein
MWLYLLIAGTLFLSRKKKVMPDQSFPSESDFTNTSTGQSSNGRQLAQQLPPTAGDARENAILGLADQGLVFMPPMVTIAYKKGGHTIQLTVGSDALMLGNVDPIRLTVRHSTAQILADKLGFVLPTTLMADATYANASKILPQNAATTDHMSDTSQMIAHSDRVNKAITSLDNPVLVADVGKDWVNTEQLLTPDGHVANARDAKGAPMLGTIAAANFGWHSPAASQVSPGGKKVLQSVGLRHEIHHVDYSQVVRPYGGLVTIDGASRTFEDVMRDPAVAFLLSDEVQPGKAARVTRHPAIAQQSVFHSV